MKKIITVLLIICLLPISALAADAEKTVVLRVGDPYMTVGTELKEIDPGRGTAPVIADGRTLVPLRALVEELGGIVEWDEEDQTVYVFLGSTLVLVEIGMPYAMVIDMSRGLESILALTDMTEEELENSFARVMDTAPVIIDGRTMLPARFVLEELGCEVEWNGDEQSVTVSYAHPEKVVSTVNGEPIYLSDCNALPIMNFHMALLDYDGRLHALQLMSAAAQMAGEFGVDDKLEELYTLVELQRDELINSMGEDVQASLSLIGTDEAAVERVLRLSAVANAVMEALMAEGGPCYDEDYDAANEKAGALMEQWLSEAEIVVYE